MKERVRFTITTLGDVVKLTPVPGQQLPGHGGEIRGEITLTGLPKETYEGWQNKEAFAELTVPAEAIGV